MKDEIGKVVVIGANGAMGAGSGEVFAAAGFPTVFLARDVAKAAEGKARAESMAKSEHVGRRIELGAYDDLATHVRDADVVFEALAEELPLKQRFFAEVDRHRKSDSIVATVSSGLSIAAMAKGRSESFRRHFLGIHLYNPPNVIVGCELVPHAETDPRLVSRLSAFLERALGRKVVETADRPAFAGNRIGFKVMNEVAQLAAERGVAFMDGLVGPHTGRALPPLATVDLVGWDVHRAIVDNIRVNTRDEAHGAFALPDYMAALIGRGHLGDKTPATGGFYRRTGTGKSAVVEVLDSAHARYVPFTPPELPAFVTAMKRANRTGRYREAMRIFIDASGDAADLLRRVILGYVSYALGRVGEVVKEPRDVDRIMAYGFNWAPPSVLVDLIGARETIAAMERAKLPVPVALADHAKRGGKLFREPNVDVGRFFVG